jgi:hypothetical protein
MRKRFFVIGPTFLLLAACGGGDAFGPPSGRDGRLILTPCDGGKAFQRDILGMLCGAGPNPTMDEPPFGPGALPCRMTRRVRTETITTDLRGLANPHYQGATYTPEGNLATISLPGIGFSIDVTYQYQKGLLSAAHIEREGAPAVDYTYAYAGDRRISEGTAVDGVFETRWYYVYDSEGRLVAEGPPTAAETPPTRYPLSDLAPPVPRRMPGDILGGTYVARPLNTYFYDADGRLATQGFEESSPLVERLDYGYDAQGRLTTLTLDQAWTTTFEYDCGP